MWAFLSKRIAFLSNWNVVTSSSSPSGSLTPHFKDNTLSVAVGDQLRAKSRLEGSPHAAERTASGLSRDAKKPSREEHAAKAWEHWRALGAPRYVMAPMVDGSELAFRTLSRRYGCQLAYTPMLHSRLMSEGEKYRRENFSTDQGDRPMVAQFCANDPEVLVEAARYVEDVVDAVDLNLGCPQGIAKRGRYGSFLQDDWKLLHRIVSTAARELKVPIWCKIRVFEDQSRTVAYARMLEDAGASLIAVHGRTREQKGKTAPPANWDAIRAVREAVLVPVIANGNVLSRAGADEAMRYTGAAAVMSAYALLDNPALYAQGPDELPDRLQLLREYLDIAEAQDTPMKMVRLHAFKLLRSRLDIAFDLNERVAKCRSIQNFRDIVECIAERTDFGGKSYEQHIADGESFDVVLCAKKRKAEVASEKVAKKLRQKNHRKRLAEVSVS